MMQKNLSITDFTYPLPEECIAKYPLKIRDSSRLLIYKNGEVTESIYSALPTQLGNDTLLIFNNTKVVEARILFRKPTGGVIEIFCLEPHDTVDISIAMQQKHCVLWRCLVGGASKWKHGQVLEKEIEVGEKKITLSATIADRLADCFVVDLNWQSSEISFADVLHASGLIPLPPYLHREAEEIDKETYQTVYAKNDGSVAAPTAGLHFTTQLLEKLSDQNVQTAFVTLHVGAGTFKPVKVERVGDHTMHAEYFEVDRSTIKTLLNSLDKKIVAVGTTSLRTIESLYWIGVKIHSDPNLQPDDLSIDQWEPYEQADKILPASLALNSLMEWMEKHGMQKLIASTQILIAPGYTLKIAKGLITNFHQPQSTLLLLVAAIAGEDWKKIYEYALQKNFRFLSYGDGSLLWAKS